MNILYILRHNPWGIGGGCYATKCYLDAFTTLFAEAQFDVCVCEEYITSSNSPRKGENVNFVKVAQRGSKEKLLSLVTGLLHRFDSKVRELLKSKKYDYCIFDHNSIAGPLVGLCKMLGVRTIVINHNCEAEYYRDNYGWLHRMLFLRHVKRAEKKSYLGCDYNIFLTEEDKVQFEDLYGKSKTQSIVTGCFETAKLYDTRCHENDTLRYEDGNGRLRLVISGTIGNVQNMDGIQYVLDELLEYVPKDAEVVIAGKNPPEVLINQIATINHQRKYAEVTLIPNPKDMMSVVNGCDIFVCPTRLGGGLKLRVMDGLRVGLPVIAHKVSARGYSEFTKQGYLWVFDGKSSFDKALRDVIQKRNRDDLNRKTIQDFAFKQFSFENKVEMLKDIFRN